MHTIKYMYTLMICLLGVALSTPVWAAEAAAPPLMKQAIIAKVTDVTPGAWVERLGQKLPVTKGMELQRVDTLATDAGGSVSVVFLEQTTATFGNATRVALESFDMRPESADLHMRLAEGTARVLSGGIAQLRPEALKVLTPMATIGIRGTECGILATPVKTELVVNSIGKKDILITNMLTLEETSLTKKGQVIEVTPSGNAVRDASKQEIQGGMPVLR